MGVNPFSTHCVIDVGCSDKFRHFAVDHCSTLTKSRAGSFGYWDSVKGGPLDVHDMCKLMGFKSSSLKWETIVSKNQLASSLGNGCSVTVLTKIIPNMLYAAGYISKQQLNLLKQRSEMQRLSLKADTAPLVFHGIRVT